MKNILTIEEGCVSIVLRQISDNTMFVETRDGISVDIVHIHSSNLEDGVIAFRNITDKKLNKGAL